MGGLREGVEESKGVEGPGRRAGKGRRGAEGREGGGLWPVKAAARRPL